jgi:hypothetical protein
MSQTLWREPQVEEAPRNLVFQNRCGNRLTMLFQDLHVELELSYKPNAFRRKDFAARTFSSRDLWSNLFAEVRIPDLGHGDVKQWGYDPFVTELSVQFTSEARNRVRVWNLPDENAFVISARAPLTLVFRPHRAFLDRQDGLFIERFTDRGEDIVSFVSFPSRQLVRLRELADGARALQLMEDDLVVIGGEENLAQIERLLAGLAGLRPEQLTSRVEATLAAPLAAGRIKAADAQLQRVLDINQRIVWSGFDAGGACIGALNRIYHLMWVRDGAMTSAHLAQAGNPALLRLWAPFLLANPSQIMAEDGSRREEYGQLVGTRWSKAEDDGIFYAVWSLFALWQATGDDALILGPELPRLVAAIDRQLESRYDAGSGLMGSDTLGEESLHSSPYFGYDVVNGQHIPLHGHCAGRRPIRRVHSLYHQANTINLLLMAVALLTERSDADGGRSAAWLDLVEQMRQRTRDLFLQPDGTLAAMILIFVDGSQECTVAGPGSDVWETAWAVSQGPFFPWPDLQSATAERLRTFWPDMGRYGICPWNCLARLLHEHGRLEAGGWRALVDQEIEEALQTPVKYPMPGALAECVGWPEGWRGLPFSIGSLAASACAQLLRALPQGVAVRGGSAVQAVTGWRWRLSRFDAQAQGAGEDVASWSIDGERFARCLQVPEDRLRAGRQALDIMRGPTPAQPRLVGSDAQLVSYREDAGGASAVLRSRMPITLLVSDPGRVGGAGLERLDLPGTRLSALRLPPGTVALDLTDSGLAVRSIP